MKFYEMKEHESVETGLLCDKLSFFGKGQIVLKQIINKLYMIIHGADDSNVV